MQIFGKDIKWVHILDISQAHTIVTVICEELKIDLYDSLQIISRYSWSELHK